MIFFLAWNLRGYNKPRKHMFVKQWVQLEKPLFGCIIETRVQATNHQTNYDHHRLGRSSSLVLFEFQLRLRSLFARPSMGLILWQKDINSGHTLELLKRPTVIFLCLGFFLEITMLPFHPLNTLRLLFL